MSRRIVVRAFGQSTVPHRQTQVVRHGLGMPARTGQRAAAEDGADLVAEEGFGVRVTRHGVAIELVEQGTLGQQRAQIGASALGRVGCSSSTRRAAAAGVVASRPKGRRPVSSWYSSTPRL